MIVDVGAKAQAGTYTDLVGYRLVLREQRPAGQRQDQQADQREWREPRDPLVPGETLVSFVPREARVTAGPDHA
jgi:hypothetical protein